MALSLASRTKLNTGAEIPCLGLGTWKMRGEEARRSVAAALREGYRLIDTAQMYGNEKEVGQGIAESGVPREEIFVTTKLNNDNHGRTSSLRSFDESLAKLGTGYIDLFLIHWPVEGMWEESWGAMEGLLRDGRCRAIGVSNFTTAHLEKLARLSKIVPAVDQVEFHPFLFQKELLEHCRQHRIVLEGYSPLVRGARMENPVLQQVAAAHHRTGAQVLLRWGLQHGVVEIPKSSRIERIRENKSLFDFELAPKEMAALDGLHEELHVTWDPRRTRP
jgi:methylglyoxal/glyoxal reductase